jgi:hypothetical protein
VTAALTGSGGGRVGVGWITGPAPARACLDAEPEALLTMSDPHGLSRLQEAVGRSRSGDSAANSQLTASCSMVLHWLPR